MFQWVRNSEVRLIKVNFPQEPRLNLITDQMEEGEQYGQYHVERNHSAYMSMRDYKHLPWQNQQPVERNPNPSRSMRDYRNPPWMSATFCSVSLTNAPFGSTYNLSWGTTQIPHGNEDLHSMHLLLLHIMLQLLNHHNHHSQRLQLSKQYWT